MWLRRGQGRFLECEEERHIPALRDSWAWILSISSGGGGQGECALYNRYVISAKYNINKLESRKSYLAIGLIAVRFETMGLLVTFGGCIAE